MPRARAPVSDAIECVSCAFRGDCAFVGPLAIPPGTNVATDRTARLAYIASLNAYVSGLPSAYNAVHLLLLYHSVRTHFAASGSLAGHDALVQAYLAIPRSSMSTAAYAVCAVFCPSCFALTSLSLGRTVFGKPCQHSPLPAAACSVQERATQDDSIVRYWWNGPERRVQLAPPSESQDAELLTKVVTDGIVRGTLTVE